MFEMQQLNIIMCLPPQDCSESLQEGESFRAQEQEGVWCTFASECSAVRETSSPKHPQSNGVP